MQDCYGGAFNKNFSKDSRMTLMLITIGITLICVTISYFFQALMFHIEIEILTFLKIAIIEALYNAIIIIIIYPLLEKLGEVLMKIFKEKNIFTKYY